MQRISNYGIWEYFYSIEGKVNKVRLLGIDKYEDDDNDGFQWRGIVSDAKIEEKWVFMV